jgi:hypothetical protein
MTLVLQVLSTFNAGPLEPSLRNGLSGAADGVGFTSQAQMSEYMVAPSFDTEHILGTVVLVRVEDWLRDAAPPTSSGDWARQELRTRVGVFVNELAVLSYRGAPVWFLACPSSGWAAGQTKSSALCRTYTNLLVARVRNTSGVKVLDWPAGLSGNELDDLESDRTEHIPFTPAAFERLGAWLAAQVAPALGATETAASQGTKGSPELAAFLAGLNVHVELALAASFSLTGEKPGASDAEIQALLDSERCLLVSVSDRLADHGPSGFLVYRWAEDALQVEMMALSCTVLAKQVEYAVLAALTRLAAERHAARIIFGYKASGRNQPMLTFLRGVADSESESRFVCPVDSCMARIEASAVNPGAWRLTFADLPQSALPRS